MKKHLFLSLLAIVCLSIQLSNAQPPMGGFGGNDEDRSEQVEKRANKLAKEMKLDGEAKKNFVSYYKEYQNKLTEAMMPAAGKDQAAKAEASEKKTLTDAEATERLAEIFKRSEEQIERQQKQLEVKRAFAKKFAEFLTPQQVVKVFEQNVGRQRTGGQGNRGGNMRGGNMPNGMGGMPGGMGGGFGGDF